MGKRNPYRQDFHTRAAKKMGYVARSVFKLEEIDQRVRVLRPGDKVLDLGAAPGSWSAYAAQKIGRNGKLISIDLKPLEQALPPHCITIEGDAFDEALLLEGALAELGALDVVLSDMAPNTTGDRSTDKIRSHNVFIRALRMADKLVRPGGYFVGKIFMAGTFDEARHEVRAIFEKVRVIRPRAVRSASYEVFLVGIGRRALKPDPAQTDDMLAAADPQDGR